MFQLASFLFFIDFYFMLPWLITAEVCEFFGGVVSTNRSEILLSFGNIQRRQTT